MSAPNVSFGPETRTIRVDGSPVGIAQRTLPTGGAWTFKLSGVAAPAIMMLNGDVFDTLDCVVRAVAKAAGQP